MKGLSKNNDDKFARQLKRDFILMMVIAMVTAIGIVITVKLGIQYDF